MLHILNNYSLNDEHIIMVHFNKIKIISHLFFSTLPRSHAKTKGEEEEEGQREVMERVCNSCLL